MRKENLSSEFLPSQYGFGGTYGCSGGTECFTAGKYGSTDGTYGTSGFGTSGVGGVGGESGVGGVSGVSGVNKQPSEQIAMPRLRTRPSDNFILMTTCKMIKMNSLKLGILLH